MKPTTPSREDWREQLYHNGISEKMVCYFTDDGELTEDFDILSDFIRNLLESSDKALVAEIEKLERRLPLEIDIEIDAIGASNAIRNQGFNEGLYESIRIIQEK